MDVQALINPWMVSGGAGLVVGAGVLFLLCRSADLISSTLVGIWHTLSTRLFTRTGFFWTVNAVFMAVSVLHAGVFFGITGNGHDIPGIAQYLGFAVSFFLDLVTIILIQALLEARYRGEEQQARRFLVFIAICCGTSTFANLAISLNDFDPHIFLPHAPFWVQIASPYVLASFPLFVIMMSLAAEMIINIRPLESLDADEYEADEKKRLQILSIRNTYLQKQADEELRAFTIRAQMRTNKQLRRGTMPKSFRWFWEKPIEIDAVITGVTTQLKGVYEQESMALKTQLKEALYLQHQPEQTAPNKDGDKVVIDDQNTGDKEAVSSDSAAAYNRGIPPSIDAVIPPPIPAIPSASDLMAHNFDQETMEVLNDYPSVYFTWIVKGLKSVSLDEIAEVTGHSKRRLVRHVGKAIIRTPKNPNLYLVSSVIKWLKTAPLPQAKSGEIPVIKLSNGHSKNTVKLDEFEVIASV